MFTHLHSHSEYSVADGLFAPKKWAKAYAERGFLGAALTDHGTMSGIFPFYKAMRAEKLTPILGMEAYLNWEPEKKDSENRKNSHLVLLAQNDYGLKNLYQLSKRSYTDGYYYRPRIGYEWLKANHEGLICLSACQGGPLAIAIYQDEEAGEFHYPRLHVTYNKLLSVFGKNFYVELQGHGGNQSTVNRALFTELIQKKSAQYIITNDNHYIKPEHAKLQQILKTSAYGNSEAAKSFTEGCDSLWMKNEAEIRETFKTVHEYLPDYVISGGIEATQEVFEKCKDLRLPEGKRYLPKFRDKIDSKQLFLKLATTKLKVYIDSMETKDKTRYIERFKTEYGVISKYNLEDYFLIVWDLVRYAEKNNIYVGLGRGSAAGCLISYLLGIVRIDPLHFDLFFERFLNAVRCETGELPDIDLDFESNGRDQIKQYIIDTYGQDKVCDIGTYGRMKLKTALIDFAKAMGVANHQEILKITTKIETDNFEEAYADSYELQKLCDKNIDFVSSVETILGQIKSQGVHPAGMIIAPEPVENLTPLKSQKSKSGDRIIATQSEDKHVIGQGLMKVDILGIKQYDIIKYVIENSSCPLTMGNYVEKIDYNDENVWDLFKEGQSDGVFQFSGDGMKQLLIDIIPDRIEDLIAANALFRPGCLRNGWHTDYCNRKNGKETSWDKIDPIVEEITKDTYGVLIYQEQVMSIINKLGGVSLIESDIIRSALGKKDEDKLKKYGPMFIEGASKHITKEKAEYLWKQIMHSSEYNFNKSHSASYSVLAYVTQYLKLYYPEHFWASVCDWDVIKGKSEDLLKHMSVAKTYGVKFVLPNIESSRSNFYVEVETNRVIMPFSCVSGVGTKASDVIMSVAPFVDFDDFLLRVNKSVCKVNNVINLIYSGVFDSFGDRKDLLSIVYSTRTAKQLEKMTPIVDINFNLQYFKALGFFETKIKDMKGYSFSPHVMTEKEIHGYDDKDSIVIGGMIATVSPTKTKRGDKMAFVTVTDNDENIKLTVFADVWSSFRSVFKVGNVIEVHGVKSTFGGANNQVEAHEIILLGEI